MKYIVSFSETENGYQPLLPNGEKEATFDTQNKAMEFYHRELAACPLERLALLDFDPEDEEVVANATFLSVIHVQKSGKIETLATSEYYWAKKPS